MLQAVARRFWSCTLPATKAAVVAKPCRTLGTIVQDFRGAVGNLTWPYPSVVPRPFPHPVFDHLQCAGTEGEGLGDVVTCSDVSTPLIKLSKLSEATGCTIAVKAENLNPGGSVKDRAALYLIKEAEEKGLIQPGGMVVEGTAGNTGIGLAHLCNSLGYKCIIFMPNTQSMEKVDALRVLGADVKLVPAVPFDNPDNYNHQAKRFAESLDNAVWTNQFDNTANRKAHFETTGPEIWRQTDGKVDAVTFGTGTGGTLAGVGMFLKSKNPQIKVVLADPQGSVLFNYFSHGKLERSEGSSITEGIGQGRVTQNVRGAPVDYALLIKDAEAVEMTYYLLHEEGFFVGASSGLNVAAAVKVAKDLGPGHTVVTCLCDSGQRYYARLFNKQWMETKGLLQHIPEKYRSGLH